MTYTDTFIQAADGCAADEGVIPQVKMGKTKPIHAI
jgi:hypothetical protein